MDRAKIQAWWAHRQGVENGMGGSGCSEVLDRSGWARSVGGCGPYLSLFARSRISRVQVDAAVSKLEIHELPSARACTYVLPANDFALGLALARAQGMGEMRVAQKLGVTEKEIERLCKAILKALEKGALDPDEIRQTLGSAVRSLGPEGKSKGLTTTLPVGLGRLQHNGQIRRVPINGRLDQQRYKYTLWQPSPLEKFTLSADEMFVALARRFFSWIGAASLADFQAFAGIATKAAKAAVEHLNLLPVASDSDLLFFEEDRASFEQFKPPKDPHYNLVSNLDAIVLLRRDLQSLFDEKHLNRNLPQAEGAKRAGDLTELSSPAILDRGRIIGVWEYDPETQSIAWFAFTKTDKALQTAIERTQEYVKSQLGDARSFSLDSPKSRAPRIAAIRRAKAS